MTATSIDHGATRVQLRAVIQLFDREASRLKRIDQGCGGCIYSEHRKDGTCKKWNQTVPAEHRAAGCDEWLWDEIPFKGGQQAPAAKPDTRPLSVRDPIAFDLDDDIPF